MKYAILHLNLHRQWFDIIGEEKIEEYRSTKSPMWCKKFAGGSINIKGKRYHPSEVVVCFSNGYAKNRPQKICQITSLRVGYGIAEWGAEPGEQYFCIGVKKLSQGFEVSNGFVCI